MLKIGLLGYGKMGKTIDALAGDHGCEIVWRITRENSAGLNEALLQTADVVIEFTRPEAAFENVMRCMEAGVPVVSGTTGWAAQLPEAENYCKNHNGALLWASNFSVGVNLFFALNRLLSGLMQERPEYEPSVTETHHIHKLDAPSGTAITLANDLIARHPGKDKWVLHPQEASASELVITAIREDEVPGTHTIHWQSAIDEIEITHRAHSRAGFASGALIAAKWLTSRKGVYSMKDVLNINS